MKKEDYNPKILIEKIKNAKTEDHPIYAAEGPCGACDVIIGSESGKKLIDDPDELIAKLEKLDHKIPLYPTKGNCGGCDVCIPTDTGTDNLITKTPVITKVGEFFHVIITCMSPGSTGYQWGISSIPNCVNLTNFGFVENMPGIIGSSGFQYFVFNAVTSTVEPPVMDFELKSPSGEIVDKIQVEVKINE